MFSLSLEEFEDGFGVAGAVAEVVEGGREAVGGRVAGGSGAGSLFEDGVDLGHVLASGVEAALHGKALDASTESVSGVDTGANRLVERFAGKVGLGAQCACTSCRGVRAG